MWNGKDQCPVCGHTHLEKLLTIEKIPVFVNVLADTREHARTADLGEQELVLCARCGFVFNHAFKPVCYSEGYHAERGASPAYRRHVDRVLAFVASVEPLEGKRVLEVACGGGEFLQSVSRRGPLRRG